MKKDSLGFAAVWGETLLSNFDAYILMHLVKVSQNILKFILLSNLVKPFKIKGKMLIRILLWNSLTLVKNVKLAILMHFCQNKRPRHWRNAFIWERVRKAFLKLRNGNGTQSLFFKEERNGNGTLKSERNGKGTIRSFSVPFL